MFECTNVVEVLQPIIIMCRVLGLLPFSIYEKGKKINLVFMAWSGICMLFFMGLGAKACQSLINGISQSVKSHSERIIAIITYLTISICICCSIAFKRKIRKTIKDVVQIDRQLKSDGLVDNVEVSYRRNSIFVYISNGFVIMSSIAIGLLYYYAEQDPVPLFCPLLSLWYTQLQFYSLVFLIRERFFWINGKLQKISGKLYFPEPLMAKNRSLSPLISSSYLQEKVLEVIRSARLRHYQLCEISEQLNTAYSVQMLLLLLNHFLRIIHILYYQSKNGFGDRVPADISSLINAVVSIIVITIVCSRACAEAKKTSSVIHDLLPCDARKLHLCKDELKYEVLQFSMQLLHNNLSFSPCNMFPIDESLLLRFLASLTTYLVIVIQFDISLKS